MKIVHIVICETPRSQWNGILKKRLATRSRKCLKLFFSARMQTEWFADLFHTLSSKYILNIPSKYKFSFSCVKKKEYFQCSCVSQTITPTFTNYSIKWVVDFLNVKIHFYSLVNLYFVKILTQSFWFWSFK